MAHLTIGLARHCLQKTLGCVLACAAASAQSANGDDLTALSLEQLLQISIVGASKYEQGQESVAAAATIISRQEIAAFGWRTLDEALASLPGVHTTNDRQNGQFGTRGFGLPGDFNTRVLVTIDGNRVNDPSYDTGFVNRGFPVDMELVERIEFIPGPGGAVYGQNAMFGVVNVITRRGANLDGAEVAVTYQPVQEQREGRASWGQLFDNGVDVLLSVSGLSARGEDRNYDFGPAGVSGVAAGLDGEQGAQVLARIARGEWSFEYLYGSRHKDDPTASYFSDPLMAGQYQEASLALTQLQYEKLVADDTLQISARLFNGELRYHSQFYYFGQANLSETASGWTGAELRLLFTGMPGHKLMVGTEGQDNDPSTLVIPQPGDPSVRKRIPRPGYRIGVFMQDEWQINAMLAATLGVRVDHNDTTGSAASPRAALIWQPMTGTAIKALYGRAHRAPNLFERAYDDGATLVANPGLAGERIDTLEFVVDQRVGKNLALRASAYHWSMLGLISLGTEPASGIAQYQPGSKVDANGLELSADRTWDRGYRLRGSLSLQDVQYTSSGAGLLNSPQTLGKLNLSAPLPFAGLHLGYEFSYGSGRLSVNGTELGGYAVSNLTLSTDRFAHRLQIVASLYNLFDRRYAQPGAGTNWQNSFEQDGRSARLHLGYRF